MRVEIFHGDNWDGMYINGRLVEEGHVLRADRAVSHSSEPSPTTRAPRSTRSS